MLDELGLNTGISSFRELDSAMTEKGLAFDAKLGRGVLLVTCGRISNHHEVSVLCVADTRAEVDSLLDEFLAEFANEEERAHFLHSRSNSPIVPVHLGNEPKEENAGKLENQKGKEARDSRVNEQGVAAV
jgi:hypothetical protein